jgi:putative heme-binding domain-containing protein
MAAGGGGAAKSAMIKSVVFSFLVRGLFIYIAQVVTSISGAGSPVAVGGVSVEAGEALFWGRGKCSTCHSIGEKGSAIRCPNLGITGDPYTLGMPMALRAVERAKERSQKTGKPYTAIDYLVESHYAPSAYVVEGFKDEMPVVWQPPIALSADDEIAIEMYIMTLGGEPDAAAIASSAEFAVMKKAIASVRGSGGAAPVAFKPYLPGDPAKGEAMFFDPDFKAPCSKCHTVKGKGGKVGPELTNVAGTRTPQFMLEAILEPSKEIASGFEPMLIVTNSDEFIAGIKKNEDDTAVEIADGATGELKKIKKSDIKKMVQQKVSIMPGNFKELLSVEELHDLLAYLLTLS